MTSAPGTELCTLELNLKEKFPSGYLKRGFSYSSASFVEHTFGMEDIFTNDTIQGSIPTMFTKKNSF
jgi:hypothetical protein